MKSTIAGLRDALNQKQLEKVTTEEGLKRANEALDGVNANLLTERNNLDQAAGDLANKELECNQIQNNLNQAQ